MITTTVTKNTEKDITAKTRAVTDKVTVTGEAVTVSMVHTVSNTEKTEILLAAMEINHQSGKEIKATSTGKPIRK
jgi:hypothetical protein